MVGRQTEDTITNNATDHMMCCMSCFNTMRAAICLIKARGWIPNQPGSGGCVGAVEADGM